MNEELGWYQRVTQQRSKPAKVHWVRTVSHPGLGLSTSIETLCGTNIGYVAGSNTRKFYGDGYRPFRGQPDPDKGELCAACAKQTHRFPGGPRAFFANVKNGAEHLDEQQAKKSRKEQEERDARRKKHHSILETNGFDWMTEAQRDAFIDILLPWSGATLDPFVVRRVSEALTYVDRIRVEAMKAAMEDAHDTYASATV